jgi:hypothetical protein
MDNGLAAFMTATAAYGDLNGVVTPYGYKDFRDWMGVALAVTFAAAWAKDGPQMDAMIAMMAKGASNLPPQAQAGAAAMAAMKPPQTNVDAVKPYLAQITPLLK